MPTRFEQLFHENASSIIDEAEGVDLSPAAMKRKYAQATLKAENLRLEYQKLLNSGKSETEAAMTLRSRIGSEVSKALFWEKQAQIYYGPLIVRRLMSKH